MINSRDLKDLLPIVAAKAVEFIAACEDRGVDVIITSTYRDAESQSVIYEQGRTTPGHIVTNAKAGESFHNYKCAFDFAPIVNGKIDWSDKAIFSKCGHIAETVGLEWAGRWESFVELAHCQYTGGLTIADLKAGKKIK